MLDKKYRSSGPLNVLSYNSHYSDDSLVKFEGGYFEVGTFSSGTYTVTNSFKDTLIVNINGHNASTDAITITSGSDVSTTYGNVIILYPGDSATLSTTNPSVVGRARHMSVN